ncbi:hypothetical protein EG329_004136 [Mollisiaceae sp. DMI_Dod_QoI]|nr:hypothetical protein EG329_004136 [Helotiales sp. DMI_Dod_QoI]
MRSKGEDRMRNLQGQENQVRRNQAELSAVFDDRTKVRWTAFARKLMDVSEKEIVISEEFESLEEARNALNQATDGLFRVFYMWDGDLPVVLQPTESLAIFDKYTSQLSLWNLAFEKFMVSKSKDLTSREVQGAALLKIHHTAAKIMAGLHLDMSDMRPILETVNADKFLENLDDFQIIINLSRSLIAAAEQDVENGKAPLTFSSDLGLIGPLYYVCINCPTVSIRTTAMKLLLQCPRREGMWDSVLVAQMIQQYWELEARHKEAQEMGLEVDEFGFPVPFTDRGSRKQPDRSYRLPKSSRIQSNAPGDGDEFSHESSSVNSQIGDGLVTCQPSDDMIVNRKSESLVTDQVIPKLDKQIPQITAEKVPQEGVEDDSPVHCDTLLPMAKESILHQLQATCTNGLKRNIVHRQPSVALDQTNTDDQITGRPSSPNAIELGDSALPEIDGKGSDAQASLNNPSPHVTELHETIMPDPTPSTPAGKISKRFQSPISNDQTATPQTAVFTPIVNGGLLSPLTEDNWPASPKKIEMSLPKEFPTPSSIEQQQTGLCSTASTEAQPVDREKSPPTHDSLAKLSPSLPEKTLTLADMIAKVVHLLYEMSRRWEIPKQIHSRIFTTIQPGLGGTPATAAVVGRPDSAYITSNSTTWSASMWINMLEAGHARSKETTILNMIEWMGASE